jgi:hypothetical protein
VAVVGADGKDESYFHRAVHHPEYSPLPIPDSIASRYSKEEGYDLLKFGEVVQEGWYFEPSEDFSTRIILSVPRDTASNYQFLRVEMNFAVAKGSRLNPDFNGAQTYPQELVAKAELDRAKYIVNERPIKPLSQIDRMVRGARAYASVVDLRNYNIPVFDVCIDDADRFRNVSDPEAVWGLCESRSALENKLWESYGLSGAGAVLDFGLARSTEPLIPFSG